MSEIECYCYPGDKCDSPTHGQPTLTEFLLARYAEDEAVAREAGSRDGGQWWVDGPAAVSGKWWVYSTGEKFTYEQIATHIARHDPARVLADVEAKRRIVGRFAQAERLVRANSEALVTASGVRDNHEQIRALRVLASVYADHPDYREEWKP